jgi:hypothetical protein
MARVSVERVDSECVCRGCAACADINPENRIETRLKESDVGSEVGGSEGDGNATTLRVHRFEIAV